MRKQNRKKRLLLLAVCYIAVWLIYLCVCGGLLLRDTLRVGNGQMTPQEIRLEDFTEWSGIHQLPLKEDGSVHFYNSTQDPQWILRFEQGQPVGYFVFDAEVLCYGPGEITMYYTQAPGAPFSEAKKLWAQRDENGAWVFDLDGKTVYALRLDTGTTVGTEWRVNEIVLNAPKPAWAYFMPSVKIAAVLLLLPLFLWSVMAECALFIGPILDRRRFENRWREEESKQASKT